MAKGKRKSEQALEAEYQERLFKHLKKVEVDHIKDKSAAVEAALRDEVAARQALVAEMATLKKALAAERNSEANKNAKDHKKRGVAAKPGGMRRPMGRIWRGEGDCPNRPNSCKKSKRENEARRGPSFAALFLFFHDLVTATPVF